MDNNVNIKTVHVCRTCMAEIINSSFFHLDFTQVDSEPTIGQKLSNCIPELDLSIVRNTVICGKCADTINSLYIFKEECLQFEIQISEYMQQVQHTDNAVDLAAVIQYHQLHSKSLTAELKTESFENCRNEEPTTSFCDDYAFNETEKYTEITNKGYLTSLQMVDRECVLFNTIGDFINSDQSEAEENSDTHDNSNIVQDCLLQVIENRDSCIQNLYKTNIYYQCFTCGHKAQNKLKLIRHLKSHTDKKLYQNKIPSKSHKSLRCWYRCDLCNYSTKHKCLFSFHNRVHLTKIDYQLNLKSRCILVKSCTSKSITFGKKDGKIKIHTLIHSRENLIKCSICQYSCKQKDHLKIHMLTHTGEKPFKCSVCEYSCNRKQNLESHMLTHTGEKPFKCSICEYSCNYRQSLKRHTLTHAGKKLFKCSICEHSFNQKTNLKTHILTHTGEKPFKCSICEYSCRHKPHLKSYIVTHTSEKPFKCLICEYSCNQRQNLKRHILTHTGEKPFKCSICEYSCNYRQNLKNHILTHAGEKPFKCSICEHKFNQKGNLKKHILTHTGEKPFKCSVCEYCSTTRNQLKIHMQNHS